MPGDVGHDRVLVVTGLHAGAGEEALGHAGELGLGEDERGPRLIDVVGKVGFELGQLLAQAFDLLASGRRQIQAGPAVVAQRLLENLEILAGEGGAGLGVGPDRGVDVLAVVEADGPLLAFSGCVSWMNPRR
jgi:hypothetical protein